MTKPSASTGLAGHWLAARPLSDPLPVIVDMYVDDTVWMRRSHRSILLECSTYVVLWDYIHTRRERERLHLLQPPRYDEMPDPVSRQIPESLSWIL
jgi:hypothetical protein